MDYPVSDHYINLQLWLLGKLTSTPSCLSSMTHCTRFANRVPCLGYSLYYWSNHGLGFSVGAGYYRCNLMMSVAELYLNSWRPDLTSYYELIISRVDAKY